MLSVITLIQREQIWRASNDKFKNVRMSLPALSKRVGIHTFFVLTSVRTAMCFPCERSDPAWRSFARTLVPLLLRHGEGCGPRVCKGICQRRDGHCLFSAFTWQVQCLVLGLGSTRCGFFLPDRGTDTVTRAGPWHRRNRQMLGASRIHKEAKMSKGVYFFFLQFYFFKRSSHKNNYCIALLSSTYDLPTHSRTSTYISYLIVKDFQCSLINYHCVQKTKALWCPGKTIK